MNACVIAEQLLMIIVVIALDHMSEDRKKDLSPSSRKSKPAIQL
jgi:hypothetical protein